MNIKEKNTGSCTAVSKDGAFGLHGIDVGIGAGLGAGIYVPDVLEQVCYTDICFLKHVLIAIHTNFTHANRDSVF